MHLKNLTELNGVSGNEEMVCKYIKAEVEKYADKVWTDSMGNLFAFRKGTVSKFKVMLSAHMDEVGFIVTGHGENGTIKFKNVGGIDGRILPGKKVQVGDVCLPGIIGIKPIHLQEPEERTGNIKIKNMYIDIGAGKKEEAESLVPLGEYISFHSEYLEFGDGCIKAKALDDRAGCVILMEAIKNTYEYDLYCCFTVQEEVGLRGSEVAAYSVNPDIAIVVEGTTCSDVPGVEKQDYSTVLGNGAAVTIMDRTAYADKNLVEYIFNTAGKKGIKVQYKQTTSGGNDAGKIQRSKGGVRTASISIPCRYIHSPVSMMSKKDYESCRDLVLAVLEDLGNDKDAAERIILGGVSNV